MEHDITCILYWWCTCSRYWWLLPVEALGEYRVSALGKQVTGAGHWYDFPQRVHPSSGQSFSCGEALKDHQAKMKDNSHPCDTWYICLQAPSKFRLSVKHSGNVYTSAANLKWHVRVKHSNWSAVAISLSVSTESLFAFHPVRISTTWISISLNSQCIQTCQLHPSPYEPLPLFVDRACPRAYLCLVPHVFDYSPVCD